MKYYAVKIGCKPGIYTSWEETKKQVYGFSSAIYKSFKTMEEAQNFIKDPTPLNLSKPEKSTISLKKENYFKNSIIVYTDGGAIGNPGPGGYGIVIEQKKELSGGFNYTTNNRMELMAVIVALNTLKSCKKLILIHSDSSYVVNGIIKGWAMKWKKNNWLKSNRKPALNSDLWKQLLLLLEQLSVEFRKVKGHSGDPLNERADELANSAARKRGWPDDVGYIGSI